MQDQDGFLYIKDRSRSFCRSLVSLNSNQALVKDIIIRGGESIVSPNVLGSSSLTHTCSYGSHRSLSKMDYIMIHDWLK